MTDEPPSPQTSKTAETSQATSSVSTTVTRPFDTSSDLRSVAMPPHGADGLISWNASEFAVHEKSAGWYALLAIGTLIISFFVWILTKGIVSVTVIVVGAIAFGVYGSRKPHQIAYQLDEAGITIGQKSYSYNDFHSFSIVPEGALSSIVFMPLKRFALPTTIYYDPADEGKIVDILSVRLPVEAGGRDAVDRLMNRLRF